MPYLVIFMLEFENTIIISEITLEFFNTQSFMQKNKILKFGTKIALFEYFWSRILKIYCHI